MQGQIAGPGEKVKADWVNTTNFKPFENSVKVI